jgi:putative component of membrane protein insertase Oxa1/YidC/SpoIIIJ protein YidD
LKEWGIVKGMFLGIKRILKCNPYGGCGHDPVPQKNKN